MTEEEKQARAEQELENAAQEYQLNLLLDAMEDGEFSQLEIDYYLWYWREWRWQYHSYKKGYPAPYHPGLRPEDEERDLRDYAAYERVLNQFVAEGRRTREVADELIKLSREQSEEPPLSRPDEHRNSMPLLFWYELLGEDNPNSWPPPILYPNYSFEEWLARVYPHIPPPKRSENEVKPMRMCDLPDFMRHPKRDKESTASPLEKRRRYNQFKINLILDAIDEGQCTQRVLDAFLWYWRNFNWKWEVRCREGFPETCVAGMQTGNDDFVLTYDLAYEAVLNRFVSEGRKTKQQVEELLAALRQQTQAPPEPTEEELTFVRIGVRGYSHEHTGTIQKPAPTQNPKYSYKDWLAKYYPEPE